MESSWTHRILGEKYDDSWQFSNIFTTNDVSRPTTKAWDQITGWFWKMSYGYLFIFSIWVTYRIIKIVLVTIINAFNLYQLRGCTTWLCLSFCNAIPVWMLTRYINKERNNKDHQDEETGQQTNTTKKQRNNNESIDLSDYIPMNITYKFPCPEDELPPKDEKTNDNGDEYEPVRPPRRKDLVKYNTEQQTTVVTIEPPNNTENQDSKGNADTEQQNENSKGKTQGTKTAELSHDQDLKNRETTTKGTITFNPFLYENTTTKHNPTMNQDEKSNSICVHYDTIKVSKPKK